MKEANIIRISIVFSIKFTAFLFLLPFVTKIEMKFILRCSVEHKVVMIEY